MAASTSVEEAERLLRTVIGVRDAWSVLRTASQSQTALAGGAMAGPFLRLTARYCATAPLASVTNRALPVALGALLRAWRLLASTMLRGLTRHVWLCKAGWEGGGSRLGSGGPLVLHPDRHLFLGCAELAAVMRVLCAHCAPLTRADAAVAEAGTPASERHAFEVALGAAPADVVDSLGEFLPLEREARARLPLRLSVAAAAPSLEMAPCLAQAVRFTETFFGESTGAAAAAPPTGGGGHLLALPAWLAEVAVGSVHVNAPEAPVPVPVPVPPTTDEDLLESYKHRAMRGRGLLQWATLVAAADEVGTRALRERCTDVLEGQGQGGLFAWQGAGLPAKAALTAFPLPVPAQQRAAQAVIKRPRLQGLQGAVSSFG